jgi:hypothetical protein
VAKQSLLMAAFDTIGEHVAYHDSHKTLSSAELATVVGGQERQIDPASAAWGGALVGRWSGALIGAWGGCKSAMWAIAKIPLPITKHPLVLAGACLAGGYLTYDAGGDAGEGAGRQFAGGMARNVNEFHQVHP